MKMVDEVGGLYDVIDDLADHLNIKDPNIVFVRTATGFSQPPIYGVRASFSQMLTSLIPRLDGAYFRDQYNFIQ